MWRRRAGRNLWQRSLKDRYHIQIRRMEMKAKISKAPSKKTVPLEEDERIVAGTLKGARECKMGLAKRFDKVEDAIAYLRDL